MKTHNSTCFSDEEIAKLKLIGRVVNNWRQRNVNLYEHPSDPNSLISEGITFDGQMRVICDESRQEWATALDYIAHGKVFVMW